MCGNFFRQHYARFNESALERKPPPPSSTPAQSSFFSDFGPAMDGPALSSLGEVNRGAARDMDHAFVPLGDGGFFQYDPEGIYEVLEPDTDEGKGGRFGARPSTWTEPR